MNTLCTLLPRAGISLIALSLLGCEPTHSLVVTSLDNPAQSNSQLPNLSSSGEGAVILSWVDPETSQKTAEQPETHSLHMARLSHTGTWSSPTTIASGSDWFVNWADFPSIFVTSNGTLAAHWLRRSGDSTYAYDVVTSRSTDGIRWSEPETPHLDGTHTEHGFVSFFNDADQPALVWLDGRNMNSSDSGHADHSQPPGPQGMTLRTRTLGEADGNPSAPSILLDDRVCDCCQTAAATTDKGAVVFYRDRSEDEIRDISVVLFDQTRRMWTTPETLYNDGWKINGCPVNGPQAAAAGSLVAVAWFTAAPTPRVQIAVSRDSGVNFSAPVVVSQDDPIGRVEVVILGSSRVLISWLEQEDTELATLKAQLFDANLNMIARTDIGTTNADRRSGFPRMATMDSERAVIAWSNWHDGQSTVKTALISVP